VDDSTRAVLDQLERELAASTLNQLGRDRSMAIDEIIRLAREVERLRERPRHPPYRKSVQGAVFPVELLGLKDVCALLAASRSSIYRWMEEGHFPSPVRTGARSVRWRVDDLQSWRSSLRTTAERGQPNRNL